MKRDNKSFGADERNFRSSYYEKVGFRSVEEKRSLEIILKEQPLDILRLRHFALRFSVPTSLKNLVWKLLLGVVPVHLDNYDFVIHQRQQQYADLQHALKIIGIDIDGVPKPSLFVIMWLLDNGKLKLDWQSQVNEDCNKSLISISNFVTNMFENDIDVYWISKGFFQCVDNFNDDISKLVQFMKIILEKEDNELYCFLLQIDAFTFLPFKNWLQSCFATLIAESSIGKIWDKLAAGSSRILVFVAVVMFMTLRRHIFKCDTVEEVVECVNKISDEVAEIIVGKAIKMWQQNGSSLAPSSGLELSKGHAAILWL